MLDMKTSWKMTLTLRMLENNLMKSKFELKTTDNQRKPNQLTKYPFPACAPMHKLAGHFLLKPAASIASSRRGPPLLACEMSTPVPKSSPVLSLAATR